VRAASVAVKADGSSFTAWSHVNRSLPERTDQRARATYFLPALTITVFSFAKSRTDTRPRATRVSVVVQVSSTSHFVPTTVAALCLPLVRKRPFPSPHSRRLRFFFAAALALPPEALQLSFSTSVRTVIGFLPLVWPSLKIPS
jgi:hypothetical protein